LKNWRVWHENRGGEKKKKLLATNQRLISTCTAQAWRARREDSNATLEDDTWLSSDTACDTRSGGRHPSAYALLMCAMQASIIILIIFIFIEISKYSMYFIIKNHNKNMKNPLEASLVNFVFKSVLVTPGC